MPKDKMPTKEDLEKQKNEQLEILKNATEAANNLSSMKNKAMEASKKTPENHKTEELLAEIKSIKEEQAKLKAESANKGDEIADLQSKLTDLENPTTIEPVAVDNPTPETLIAPEPTPVKTKEKKAEVKKTRKNKQEQVKITKTKEDILAKMEPVDEKEELYENQNTEKVGPDPEPMLDQDTLEQTITSEYFPVEEGNKIARIVKDGGILTAEQHAIYEKYPETIEQLARGKWYSPNALINRIKYSKTGQFVKNLFSKKEKSEKIVITDEEIAEHHPEVVENNEIKLDESVDTNIEPEIIEPEIEDKEQTIKPENEKEKKPKKESNKEREARLKQEFIEKVQNEIDAKMAGEWAGTSDDERAEKARALYMAEKDIFEKGRIERAGIITKSLHATENWWKNLENKKGGAYLKTAISSSMVGIGIIGGGLLTGSLEANAGKIAWRLGSRVGLATALNSALASNRMRTVISTFSPKIQSDIKASKYLLAGTGIVVSGIMGGWLVAGIAAGGYGIRKIINAIKEYSEKKIVEKESSVNNGILKSEDFKDGYDRNKMLEKISLFDEAYTKLAREKRFNARMNTYNNYMISTSAGLATLIAMSPEIAHAENDTKVEEVQKDMIQDKNGNWIENPKFPEPNPVPTPESAPVPAPDSSTPEKIDFIEVKAGDGVTQTLKRFVDEGKAPAWVADELGKNPNAEDYAKFAEKFGMLHAKDFEDSIKVSVGDSFGFNEKGDFVWKHDGEEFTVVKIDEHGHSEEGDWMDKMQDEKFIHSVSNDPTIGEWKGGGVEAVKTYYENQEAGGPTIINEAEKIDINKIIPPEPIEQTNNTNDTSIKTETNPINPYNLNPDDLEYVNKVYNSNLSKIFTTESGNTYWKEIATNSHANKSAFNMLQFNLSTITAPEMIEKKSFIEFLQKIQSITHLEPYHPNILNPEIPFENCKEYINRAMQYAYKNNKLNEITL